ncbi:annexin B11-like [Diorhabda sublineata]|uniref:annexin B11-like n=1 Tax=Diorhabda sublineata TaxID=1163346 RepID=UPI0024E10193|nr:annexin B11-like [Diorhabda sublineata]
MNILNQWHSPTVVPVQLFNATEDAQVLRKAIKGFGTDDKTIIKILARRNNRQRLQIANAYKTLFGKDLLKDFKGKLSADFANLVIAMMTPTNDYYVKQLEEAMEGTEIDEDALIEILCTKSNEEIRFIKQNYEKLCDKSLQSDLKRATFGTFKRILVSQCNACRDNSTIINPKEAFDDVQALLKAGEHLLGTDESIFITIMCQRNYLQLKLVFEEYHRITSSDIEKDIKSKFSGNSKAALLAIVRSIRSQPTFYAKMLNRSMKGLGTNNRQLIRIVVTRSEIDMGFIKKEYQARYRISLADAIKGDCSGSYKKCLLALIDEL